MKTIIAIVAILIFFILQSGILLYAEVNIVAGDSCSAIGSLSITNTLTDLAIDFEGVKEYMHEGESMTVTATFNQDGIETYQWYLDNKAIVGATTPIITIGTDLAVRDEIYTLSLIVTKAGATAVRKATFRIIDSMLFEPLDYVLTSSSKVFGYNKISWGDYDNDGLPDLLVSFGEYTAPILYHNEGGNIFRNSGIDMTEYRFARLYFEDFNRDGYADISTTAKGSVLAVNNHDGTFSKIDGFSVVADWGSLDWGDYDDDGDLDLVIAGVNKSGIGETSVYRNDNGSFNKVNTNIDGIWDGEVVWGDYDGDGDLDLAVSGHVEYYGIDYSSITKIYRNDDGIFIDIDAGIPGHGFASLAWGDYDNDGDLDLIIIGRLDNYHADTSLYRNDNGVFVKTDFYFEPTFMGMARWGDYDKDGDLDLVMTGWGNPTRTLSIYENKETYFNKIDMEILKKNTESVTRGFDSSSVAFCDYDGDGDLDLAVAGNVGTFTDTSRKDDSLAIIYQNKL